MVMDRLKVHFRPEFLNRIDEVIVFRPLTQEDMKAITLIQINLLKNRLADQKIEIEFDSKTIDHISEMGYDPSFGARPLKRYLQQTIMDPLALKILEGEFQEGSKIKISFNSDQKLVFMKLH
jgi:ATP-dependent Clp protease ATP-binding subunit ClpB